MAGFTKALQQELLDHYFGSAYTANTNWYVGLFTTAPTADDGTGGTEVTGGSYARVSTVTADWNAAVAGGAGVASVVDNANAVTFPTATANWGTVVAFGIWAASTGGTCEVFGTLGTSKAVNNGDTAEFAAGDLDVKMGDPGDTY